MDFLPHGRLSLRILSVWSADKPGRTQQLFNTTPDNSTISRPETEQHHYLEKDQPSLLRRLEDIAATTAPVAIDDSRGLARNVLRAFSGSE
jgi:hypothetical protein